MVVPHVFSALFLIRKRHGSNLTQHRNNATPNKLLNFPLNTHPTKKQRVALHPSKIKAFSLKGGSGRNRTADTIDADFTIIQDIAPVTFYQGKPRCCASVAFSVAMLHELKYPLNRR